MPPRPTPDDATVRTFRFADDGRIPNHPSLPLVLYRGVLPEDAAAVEELFGRHGWGGTWRDGIFTYHHYHSTSHEALGVVGGHAVVCFGGEAGEDVEIAAGDLAVLPAGTGHKLLRASADFLVVGAYPRGQEDYDLLRGLPDERPAALHRIRGVDLPGQDPAFGIDGPLLSYWGVATG